MTHPTYYPGRYNHPDRIPHGPIVDLTRASSVAEPSPPGWLCCQAHPSAVIGFDDGSAIIACRVCVSTVTPSRRFVLMLKVTDAVRAHWDAEDRVSRERCAAREHADIHRHPYLTHPD